MHNPRVLNDREPSLSESDGEAENDADYSSEEESVHSDVDVLLVRTPEPGAYRSDGFNPNYGAVGCLFAVSSVVGLTLDDDYQIISTSSKTISAKSKDYNDRNIKNAVNGFRNKRRKLADKQLFLLNNYACSVSNKEPNCFHLADLSSVGTQMKYAPWIAWLLSKNWTQSQIMTRRTTVADPRGFTRVVESSAVRELKEMFHRVLTYKRNSSGREVTLYEDICARWCIKFAHAGDAILNWHSQLKGLYIEMKMFVRLGIAHQAALLNGDTTHADYIHSHIVSGCMSGHGLKMEQYPVLISDPLAGIFALAKDVGGYKLTVSDDIVLTETEDFGDDLVSNSPRRGLGANKMTLWPHDPSKIHMHLENSPIPGMDVAMHLNDAVGTPHIRLYPRDTVRVWTSKSNQMSLSLLAVDIWIAVISRFWSMHILRNRGDTDIQLTGIDSSLPRPYSNVLNQITDTGNATYGLTLFFALTYNMSLPADILELWLEYRDTDMDSHMHHHVWWFFMAYEQKIRSTPSYRFIALLRDSAIRNNTTPISPALHKKIMASPHSDKFAGYSIVQFDTSLDSIIRITTRPEWKWMVVDSRSVDVEQEDIDDVFERFPRTVPRSDHVIISCTSAQLKFFKSNIIRGFIIAIYPLYTEKLLGSTRTNLDYQFLHHALEYDIGCVYDHPFSNYVGENCRTVILTPEAIL
jgi:hypothetical protein